MWGIRAEMKFGISGKTVMFRLPPKSQLADSGNLNRNVGGKRLSPIALEVRSTSFRRSATHGSVLECS
jgi:hypothetical protein